MNEIDKLFKNKLRDRQFEFKEAYWQAAENLIEQEERKRNRGLLWWSFGLLALIVMITGLFFLNNQKTAPVVSTESIAAKQHSSQSSNVNDIQKTPDNQISVTTETISDQNANENDILTPAVDSNSKIPTSQRNSDPANFSNNKYSNTTPSKQQQNKSAAELIKPDNDISKSDNLVSENFQNADTDLLENTYWVEYQKQPSIPNVNPGQLKTEPLAPIALTAVKAEGSVPEEKDNFKLVKLKPERKRFAFGILAEGVYYPKDFYRKRWVGAAIGGLVMYKINRNIGIRSGLQFTVLNNFDQKDFQYANNGSPSLDTSQPIISQSDNQYSFGLRNVTSGYNPRTLYLLEMPIMLQLSHRRQFIETGLLINYLADVRGKQVHESSLYPWEEGNIGSGTDMLISESADFSALPIDNFKRWNSYLMLGYGYNFNPRFAIHLSAFYKLDNYPAPIVAVGAKNPNFSNTNNFNDFQGRLHFRVGAKWYFKN